MVKIITDSSTLYTIEEGRKAGMVPIPLCVSIGGCHGRDFQMDMDDKSTQNSIHMANPTCLFRLTACSR